MSGATFALVLALVFAPATYVRREWRPAGPTSSQPRRPRTARSTANPQGEPMNNPPPKYIDPAEFRELGFLQEINRRILHPAGLAMEMTINPDGTLSFSGCWDYRDDPEGIYFGPGMIDPAKVASVNRIIGEHVHRRHKFLGLVVQEFDTPVPPFEEADQP